MDSLDAQLEKLACRISGEKKNDTAIVMPCGPDTSLLSEHLALLSRQKGKGFDILILGHVPATTPKGLNIIHYSEKAPLGSSGSFSIGQLLAYCLGYEFVANADVDCFPCSDDFVGALVEIARKQGKAVLPLSDEEGKKGVYCINRYGIVPRKAIGKTGFVYAGFFKGAEDIDYQLRLDADGLLLTTDRLKTRHPYLSMVLFEVASGGPKYLYYYRAGLAIQNLTLYHSIVTLRAKEALLCAGRLLYNYCYNFVFSSMASRTLFGAMWDAFLMDLGKRYDGISFAIPKARVGKDALGTVLDVGQGRPGATIYFEEWKENIGTMAKVGRRLSHVGKFLGLFSTPGIYFAPTEVFIEKYGFLIPYLMFIKPVRYKGNDYGWGKHPTYLLAGIVLLLATLPFFPMVVAFSQLRIMACGDYPPKTGNAKAMLKNFASVVLKEGKSG